MLGRRQKYELHLKDLKAERSSWDQPVRDIAEQLVPYRTTWSIAERNRGDRKDQKILNGHPVLALRTLVAGLMAGITSPARDWFGLTVSDPELAKSGEVKSYLDTCRRIIAAALQTSNWYRCLSGGTYPDLASIGTAPMFQESDADGSIYFRPLVWGEYYLDSDHRGKVNACFREVPLTCRQLVERFGLDNASDSVKNAWGRSNYGQVFTLVHAVKQNEQHSGMLDDRRGVHPWASCWWETADNQKDRFLDETGYEDFPVLAPRWSVKPGDTYGRGPGWDARGDCRLLQYYERSLMELIDKTKNPPMKASVNLSRASLLAGDVTWLKQGKDAFFEPLLEIPPATLAALREDIARTEGRVSEALFNHLWQMLMNDERNERPTATEVEAKRQEVMLQMGPVLENVSDELLDPCIERTFLILDRLDKLPLPPQELEGLDVKVEFISIMHQMQQATGLLSVRTLMQEVQLLAQTHPEVVDMVDADAVVEELGRITGVKPGIVLSKEAVEKIRGARAQREQVKQQGEAMLQATQGMSNLSSVEPAKLSELAASMSPAVAAQGGGLGEVLQ